EPAAFEVCLEDVEERGPGAENDLGAALSEGLRDRPAEAVGVAHAGHERALSREIYGDHGGSSISLPGPACRARPRRRPDRPANPRRGGSLPPRIHGEHSRARSTGPARSPTPHW